MSSAIILDTETTDFNNAEVMELAFIHHGGQQPFLRRYRPTKAPTFGAAAVHNILPHDVEACEPSTSAPKDVPPVKYWIGHNIDFDWRALGSPPGVKRICTLALSRLLWPECDSHTLGAMMYFTHGMNLATQARVRQAHSALDDVLMTADLLLVICKTLHVYDLDELYEQSEDARVPRLWTFGKFKGQPISAADRGYANWYRRQAEPDPYVIEALRRASLL